MRVNKFINTRKVGRENQLKVTVTLIRMIYSILDSVLKIHIVLYIKYWSRTTCFSKTVLDEKSN